MSDTKTVDLQRFCAPDYSVKQNMKAPFSIGEHTYATNSHLIVRVPRVAGIDEVPNAPDVVRLFSAEFTDQTFRPALYVDLPAKTLARASCDVCYGRGTKHDCPNCLCACEGCGLDVSMSIGMGLYDARYIRLLMELPGLLIQAEPDRVKPLSFRFDGHGAGMLMPLRTKYDTHLDVSI